MNKYDATNYIKYPSLIVDGNGANFTALNSSLLLIKWHVLSPTRDRKLRHDGEVTIETHTPLGNLPETKQTLIQSMDSQLIQFLSVPLVDNLPYDLTFTNGQLVTKSQLTIWEFIPYIISPNFFMSSVSNPSQPQSDPAVIAALSGIAASSQQVAANVAAADQSKQTFGTISADFKATTKFNLNDSLAVGADPKTREVIITNNNPANGAQFKVILGTTNLPNANTPFTAITNYEQAIVMPGGSQVISDPTCRTAIYVISSVDQAPVNIVRSFLVLPSASAPGA
jgi:hypothetical protein